MTSSRVLLCRAPDRVQAHVLANALDGAGIESVIAGGNAPSASGHRAYMERFTEIWVLREDAERARGVLASLRSEPSDDRDRKPWTCINCSEAIEAGFDVCWSCGVPRPETL